MHDSQLLPLTLLCLPSDQRDLVLAMSEQGGELVEQALLL
jgi:hypothetical protein